MSQPTYERDILYWLDRIAQARTEGAEAMRKSVHKILNLNTIGHLDEEGVGRIRILKALSEIHALPTTEGDTTPTERGEESGDLLAECRKNIEDLYKHFGGDEIIEDGVWHPNLAKIMERTRALLARLPKGKETQTP